MLYYLAVGSGRSLTNLLAVAAAVDGNYHLWLLLVS